MGMTLREAEKLCEGGLFKERVQTHGLERVLRWLFRRPKYRWVSVLPVYVLKLLEEEGCILDRLTFSGVKGNPDWYWEEKEERE